MWSETLREEIEGEFAALATCVDPADIRQMRRHDYLTTSRATTVSRDVMTDEQRRDKRRALEKTRRAYRTEKQREYRAKAAA